MRYNRCDLESTINAARETFKSTGRTQYIGATTRGYDITDMTRVCFPVFARVYRITETIDLCEMRMVERPEDGRRYLTAVPVKANANAGY